MGISQAHRFLEISTPLGEDAVSLTRFSGKEGLSMPFSFTCHIKGNLPTIEHRILLNQPATIKLKSQNITRVFHGYITTLKKLHQSDIKISEWELTVRPWWWYLQLTQQHRVFQHKTIVDIFKMICNEQGFSQFDISQLKKSYSEIPYIVQYNESDFDFLSRILNEHGIFYYFEHNDYHHTMILSDQVNALPSYSKPILYSQTRHDEAHLYSFSPRLSLIPNNFEWHAYSDEQPSTPLIAKSKTSTKKQLKATLCDTSCLFKTINEGQIQINQRVKSIESEANENIAQSNILDLSPGIRFQLNKHPQNLLNTQYMIREIFHEAHDTSHQSHSDHDQNLSHYYDNQIICIDAISAAGTFVPKRGTPKSHVSSFLQSARVSGETNKFPMTNSYGAVKVQFFWDSVEKPCDDTSCWVRVAQSIAGHQYGHQFIPRVGEEVLIHYINGNVNQPIILGSLNNTNHPTNYLVPNEAAKSGFKSHTLASEEASQGNELQFDDSKDQNQIFLHASKDMSTHATLSLLEKTQNNQDETIYKDQTITSSSGSYIFTASKSIEIQAGNANILIEPTQITISSPSKVV